MRVGLLVDATCDLPTSVFQRNKVQIIPTSLAMGRTTYIDTRNPDSYSHFYQQHNASQLSHATYASATSEALESALQEDLLYQYDHLLVMTPHIKLSTTLQNLREAVFQLQPRFVELRLAANLKTPFKIRIVECNTAYTGYGLVLYEALRLLNEKARTVDQIKKPLDTFKTTLETFVLPGYEDSVHPKLSSQPFNLNWLALQKLKLNKSLPVFHIDNTGISELTNLTAKTSTNDFFEFIYDKLTQTKLKNHMVNISYAGNLAQLRVKPIFRVLNEHVKNKGGKMVYSVMSPTSSVQLGKGALTVSFAGDRL